MKISFSRKLAASYIFVVGSALLATGAYLTHRMHEDLPLAEVDQRVNTLQSDLLKAGAVATTVTLMLAVIIARRISRPLEALTSHAKAIGQGRFSSVISVQSEDELGRLAAAFGEMAKRVEQMVGESDRERKQLAVILAALVESVVALDHQGRILFVNAAAERLFHLAADQAKGRSSLEVLRHSPLNAVLTEALNERRVLTREVTIHAPEEHILSVHAVPVDYAEKSTGVLAAMHDVTELRRLEHVRQEFVANVTHELGTPLTAILGFVETLLGGAIDDPQHNRDFLRTIQEHALRLKRLIDDLLTLSSVEGRWAAFRIASMSLQEVLSRVLKGLAPVAQAKKVVVQNTVEASLTRVFADPEKVEQILINLIDNAIKFTPGGGQVEVRAIERDQLVEVFVKDTGIGIPSEDVPRIFERFYRVEKARSREMGGTGLGLSIVKHLTEAQGGTVRVESQPEKGSTFIFTLPLVTNPQIAGGHPLS